LEILKKKSCWQIVVGKVVGVLALQGAFIKHIEMLQWMGVSTVQVRQSQDLEKCDGLILPGGESTTMHRQIHFSELESALREFAKTHPVMGTCAGLILMAQWGLLDVEVERNGYGPQIESCVRTLNLKLPKKRKQKFSGIFIRAPKIINVGNDVHVLAEMDNEPVLVQQGMCLAATFHPELTHDTLIHDYFLRTRKRAYGRQSQTTPPQKCAAASLPAICGPIAPIPKPSGDSPN